MTATDRVMKTLEQALASKYQVLRWIGGGGMAQVYLARHKITGGLFAIKVLSEYLAQDQSIVERFLLEARTAASLSGHPNIVPIFDVGEQDEVHYLIMQYVDGEDLKTYLGRNSKLPPAEAAGIIEQVAGALQFAHARRVIHRDLKPSNIRLDHSGRAIVLDFGIAKAGETPTLLTATGQRVGTPQYMAPERFLAGECDQRSDLYSLGIVFFELITGVRPFDADTIGAIEAAHHSKPVPPIRHYAPDVPEAYDRIIRKLLEKQPSDRYPSADALLNDLRSAEAPLATAREAAPGPLSTAAPARAASSVQRLWLIAMLAVAALTAGVAAIRFLRFPELLPPHAANALSPRLSTPTGDMVLVNGPAPFYIDEAAVTNTTYKSFCDTTGYPFPDAPAWDPGYFFKYPGKPVVSVTHEDAAAFAKWAGKRLPTEAEWDAAARVLGTLPGDLAEWTSTRYTPAPAEAARIPRLDPAVPWFALKRASPVGPGGWPAGVRPRALVVGFRCARVPDD